MAMLLLGSSADTVVTAVSLVVIVVCLCIIAWARTHPHPRREREQALEDYARRVAEAEARRKR
jgi:hypothetical protein